MRPRPSVHSDAALASADVPSVRLTTVRPESASPDASSSSRAVAAPFTLTITSEAAETASRTVAARTAPPATRASAFSGERFHTAVGCPPARNACASAVPISPSPNTATLTGGWASVCAAVVVVVIDVIPLSGRPGPMGPGRLWSEERHAKS
ncbi:hypothetical protein GCM10010230_46110 [Streptomyces narbonensis]|nr:hypothetical protein GCM10010230_46110 [Streptomyces narbonensis]